jgi:hypothetical protein
MLWMWTNGTDYVIAENADEANVILRRTYAIEDVRDLDPVDDDCCNPNNLFRFHEEDGTTTTKTMKEWVEEFGKGFFASTEY